MTTRGTNWVLASASPRRREILAGLGLRFRILPSAGKEPAREPGESPARYATRAAHMKAAEAAQRIDRGVVIGTDTVVVAAGRVMGKPASKADARMMLRRLSGRWHEVVSGICLIDCGRRRVVSAHSLSRVHFRRISPVEVEWYLKRKEYKDKAGAYAIQGHASLFIDRIEGCYFNIVGFPVPVFERLCRRLGISLTGKNR